MITISGKKVIGSLVLMLILLALLEQLRGQIKGLAVPFVFQKDLTATYVLAKAIATGANPYATVADLAARFIPDAPLQDFLHPTPHPPMMGLIFLPFAIGTYQQAAAFWWLAEIVFLSAAMFLLLRALGVTASKPMGISLIILVFIWGPVWEELLFGQFSSLLLLLLVFTWRGLRKGENISGGLFLGGIIGLKLMLWPVALHLLLRRRWLVVTGSAAIFALLNFISAMAIGFERLWFYYHQVGRIVAPLYQSYEGNIALWSIGWRTFEGVKGIGTLRFYAPPLIDYPQAAPFLSAAILLIWLTGSLWLAHRMQNFDLALALMVCTSLFVNPVAWLHYLTLLILPIMIAAMFLKDQQLRKQNLLLIFVTALLLLIPGSLIRQILVALSTGFHRLPDGTMVPQVSFALGLLTYLPVIAVMSLMLLLWRLDRQTADFAEMQVSLPDA